MAWNFFEFKGYLPFSAGKLAALQDTLRQKRSLDPLVFADQHRTFERAWSRQWDDVDVLSVHDEEVAAVVVWRAHSAQANTTMFAYAAQGNETYMLFHTNAVPTPATENLARFFDFFVAAPRDGVLTVLSADEWERSKRAVLALPLRFHSAVTVRGTLVVEQLTSSVRVPRMSRGYRDATYAHECAVARTALHDSNYVIEQVCRQHYTRAEETTNTFFTFDRYPHIRSLVDRQSSPSRLVMLRLFSRGHTPFARPLATLQKRYTVTFARHDKSITINGVTTSLSLVLSWYFSHNNHMDELKELALGDEGRNLYDRIEEYREEAKAAYKNKSSVTIDVSNYVAAAALAFLVQLEQGVDTFIRTDIKDWMKTLTYGEVMKKMALASISNGLAYNVFMSYLYHGTKDNRSLATWFLSKGVLPTPIKRDSRYVVANFEHLKAPEGSLFAADGAAQTHVADLSVYVLNILGVRAGGYNNFRQDVEEKAAAASIEAVVAMEILFPFARSKVRSQQALLTDCRLWIAAWLFAFKVIVDYQVTSARIELLLSNLRKPSVDTTNAEADALLFTRLFGLPHATVPHVVGGLMPTLSDLRRHIDRHSKDGPVVELPTVYDIKMDWLPYGTSVIDDHVPVSIKYSGDVDPTLYAQAMVGDRLLPLERTGDVLRKVLSVFFGDMKSDETFRSWCKKYDETVAGVMSPAIPALRHVIEELTIESEGNRLAGVAHVPPDDYHERAVNAMVSSFRKKFKTPRRSFDKKELLYIAWLVHSPLMRRADVTRTTEFTVLVRKIAALDGQVSTEQLNNVYTQLQSPASRPFLSIFNLGAVSQLPVSNLVEASLPNAAYLDVPVSFARDVLGKVAPPQYVDGFPVVEQQYVDAGSMRAYKAYSDFIALFSATSANDALYDNLLDTLSADYRNHFKMSPAAQGSLLTTALVDGMFNRLDALTNDAELQRHAYLARDVVNKNDGKTVVFRLLTELPIPVSSPRDEAYAHYMSRELVPVETPALDLLDGRQREPVQLGRTSHGISHYFKYGKAATAAAGDSALLLRLLAASSFGSWSPLEFYAPISGYIHSSLAGAPSISQPSKSMLYEWTGSYLASRRGLGPARHIASGITGYAPIVDAVSSEGESYRKRSAALEPPSCRAYYSKTEHTHVLQCTEEGAADFGVLAAEVTRIQFTVYGVRRVPIDVQQQACAALAAAVRERIFSTEQLYPVDEMAWFQFVDAVPGKAIPDTVLAEKPLRKAMRRPASSTTTNKKRAKDPAPTSRRARTSNNIDARLADPDPFAQHYTTMITRITAYRAARSDVNDPNFRRDFVDFYLRHVVGHLGEGVFVGSTGDGLACARYHGTPVLEERRPSDLAVITKFFANPEDVLVMPSGGFPNWHVAIFVRSANIVHVMRYTGSPAEDVVFARAMPGAALVSEKLSVRNKPALSFFAMARYVELLLRREDRLAPLTEQETHAIDDDMAGYFALLDAALAAVPVPMQEESDRDERSTVARSLTASDRAALRSKGTKGYLYDNVIEMFGSWLHLTWSAQNPSPYPFFRIYTSLFSELIVENRTMHQQAKPDTELAFYPWFDRPNKHFYLIALHYPTRTAFCIDSLIKRKQSTIETYASRILQQYQSEASSRSLWKFVFVESRPMQKNGYQCGDFTMSNVQYLIQWYIDDRQSFFDAMGVLRETDTLYTPEQIKAVLALVKSFRGRVLKLAAVADKIAPPAAPAITIDDDDDDPDDLIIIENSPTRPSSSVTPPPSPIRVDDDDDEYAILELPPDVTSEEPPTPIRIDNPSLFYVERADGSRERAKEVYPTCVVTGYELCAQRFGNRLRYCRYGGANNARFVRERRDDDKMADEPGLSYWRLTSESGVAVDAEIAAQTPPGEVWRRLLMTGYPYENDVPQRGAVANSSQVGPTLGVGARILPLVAPNTFLGTYSLAASPLPLYRPRTIPN